MGTSSWTRIRYWRETLQARSSLIPLGVRRRPITVAITVALLRQSLPELGKRCFSAMRLANTAWRCLSKSSGKNCRSKSTDNWDPLGLSRLTRQVAEADALHGPHCGVKCRDDRSVFFAYYQITNQIKAVNVGCAHLIEHRAIAVESKCPACAESW